MIVDSGVEEKSMSIIALPEREYFDSIEYQKEVQSLRVTAAELVRFEEQSYELAGMIGDAKDDLAEDSSQKS